MAACRECLEGVAGSIGSEVVEWPLVESGAAWELALGRLDELLRAGTRLLVTNAPHNPTGFQPSAAEWRRIHELARERGVRWFSDEMYRGLEPEPALALPPAASQVQQREGISLDLGSGGLPQRDEVRARPVGLPARAARVGRLTLACEVDVACGERGEQPLGPAAGEQRGGEAQLPRDDVDDLAPGRVVEDTDEHLDVVGRGTGPLDARGQAARTEAHAGDAPGAVEGSPLRKAPVDGLLVTRPGEQGAPARGEFARLSLEHPLASS